MAFLPGEKNIEGKWEVHCIKCGVTVDIMPTEEIPPFMEYLTRTGDAPMCYECEGYGADLVPMQLLPLPPGNVVYINDEIEVRIQSNQGAGKWPWFEVTCLSSRPHFNTLSKNA